MFATVFSSPPEFEPVAETSSPTREQVIECHLPLVTFTVNRMSEFLSSGVMEREDAISCGVKGLISAVDRFDESRGTTFSTYAVLRIRGAIMDAARSMDILPRSQRQRMRELEQVTLELANNLGRWPTVKELALKTGHSIDDVRKLQGQRGMYVQSLEQANSGRDDDFEWELEDPDETCDPAFVADRKAVSKLLGEALEDLGGRDREIINMLYNQGLPMRVVGAHLRISESRVSQLHRRALSRLRTFLYARDVA